MKNNRIQRVMDESLSHMEFTNKQKQAVFAEVKGEKIVKKKISTGLVFAMVLVLVAGLALAVVHWRGAGEQVATLEAENGYFDTWSTENKVEMVRLLSEAGELENTSQVDALLNGDLSGDAADKAATEIITQRVGLPEDAISFISVMESILGKYPTWSIEDKAWYSAVLKDTGRLGADEEINVLPAEGAMSEGEALAIAKDAILTANNLSAGVLDQYQTNAYYYVMPGDLNHPKWLFEFCAPTDAGYDEIPEYYAAVDPELKDVVADPLRGIEHPGTANESPEEKALRAEKGAPINWTMEERAAVLPDRYGMPKEGDAQLDEAIAIAKRTLNEKGVSTERLNELKVFPVFQLASELFPGYSVPDTWSITFEDETMEEPWSLVYMVSIHGQTGEVLDISGTASGELAN